MGRRVSPAETERRPSELLRPFALATAPRRSCNCCTKSFHLILKLVKKSSLLGLAILLCTAVLPAQAQPGGRGFGGGAPLRPRLGAAAVKLFGEHTGFSATMEMRADDGSGKTMTMPGDMAFLEGKSRFAMDLSLVQGGRMPPGAGEQMKAMGMGDLVSITRPDKKVIYVVYPGLESERRRATSGGHERTGRRRRRCAREYLRRAGGSTVTDEVRQTLRYNLLTQRHLF